MSTTDKPEGYVFGRPTLYRPEYCEKVIEWGAMGKSRTWMAAHLGIDRATIDRWANQNEDFRLALTRAKALEQAHWEDLGHNCMVMEKGSFSQTAWGRSMAARFPDDWREKVGHVGGSKDDEPIRQEVNLGADAFTRAIVGLASRGRTDEAPGSSDTGNEG